MTIIRGLLYLYLLLKPFYIFSSGTLQISDAFVVIAFFLSVILWKDNKEIYDARIRKKLLPLVIFIVCVCIINIINYILYPDLRFLLATAQYIFIFMGILVFSTVIGNKEFIANYIKIININIILQFLIYICGIGRYYDATRYMGTFNDPNQLGFFLIMSLSMLFLFENYLDKKRNILTYLLIAFLLLTTSSTGMLLASGSFAIMYLFVNNKKRKIIITKKKIYITLTVLIMLSTTAFTFYQLNNTKVNQLMNSFVGRIEEKLNKIDNDGEGIIEERGIDRLIKYPQYILLGAGDGAFERFEKSYHFNEIHSTLPSMLFYYGVIPFVILIYWLYINIKGMRLADFIPYVAILIESFTLQNQRQLLLWMLIIFANILKTKKI